MEITPQSIAGFIDHTDVKPDATENDIKKLCAEAVKYGFHSVCVTPYRVHSAAEFLKSTNRYPEGRGNKVEIICVVGFPFGVATTEEKIEEAIIAKSDGATEIDMIINIGAVKEHDWNFIKKEIHAISQAIKPLGLKVIMEIGFLTKPELIKACQIAEIAGAKFVKTSTGYGPRKPTTEDIKIMRQAVGLKIGVKASGGIHDFKKAKAMIEAGATRIGTSSSLQIIGALEPKKKEVE